MRHSTFGNVMHLSDSRCSVLPSASSAEFIARCMSPNRCAKIALCERNGTESFFLMCLTIPQRSRNPDGKPDFCDWRDWESNTPPMSKNSGEAWKKNETDSNKPA